MSQSKSPDGSFPTFPFTLPVDGEPVTEDKLCVSPTAGLGWVGKLIDAVGYLQARTPQLFIATTNGSGAVSLSRRTPKTDGATAFFSAIALVSSNRRIRLTFTTPLANARDAMVQVHYVGSGDFLAQHITTTTTYCEVVLRELDADSELDLSTQAADFQIVVYPNLAGMT